MGHKASRTLFFELVAATCAGAAFAWADAAPAAGDAGDGYSEQEQRWVESELQSWLLGS